MSPHECEYSFKFSIATKQNFEVNLLTTNTTQAENLCFISATLFVYSPSHSVDQLNITFN